MVIDSRLTTFKSQLKDNISLVKNNLSDLKNDLSSFRQYCDNFSGTLSTIYKSTTLETVNSNILFIKQTTELVDSSLTQELSIAITKSENLLSEIDELEKINQMTMSSDLTDEARNSYINSFNSKQLVLIKEYEELIKYDEDFKLLSQFGIVDQEATELLHYDGINFSSMYYEQDGVIYQKIMPIYITSDNYNDKGPLQMNETYVITYNKNAILSACKNAGNESIGQAIIDFLQSKKNGTTQNKYLFDYVKKEYSKEENVVISVAIDQILQDTYKTMNCNTISSYALVSSLVATNSVVHLAYGHNGDNKSYGFKGILTNGGKLVCDTFVEWCYGQGIYNYYKNNLGKVLTKQQLENIVDYQNMSKIMGREYTKQFSNMTQEDVKNVKPGSIIYRGDSYHVGMVIGHTKVNGEEALVIAQECGQEWGTNITVTKTSELRDGKWTSYLSPEDSQDYYTGAKKSNKI